MTDPADIQSTYQVPLRTRRRVTLPEHLLAEAHIAQPTTLIAFADGRGRIILADTAAMVLTPTENRSTVERLVGPFYREADTAEWLHTDVEALRRLADAQEVFSLVTGSGERVYPSWQFTADRQPIPHLAAVLAAFTTTEASDPWGWALWLNTPNDALDGLCAWEWLANGYPSDAVLTEIWRLHRSG